MYPSGVNDSALIVPSVRTGDPHLQRAGDRHACHNERQELRGRRGHSPSYPPGEPIVFTMGYMLMVQ